jgi:transketolase
MRKVFFKSLAELSQKDKDIFFITADLGYGFIDEYSKNFPEQFMNIGVSEQAMLGISNGLAKNGKKVICYSIATFSLLRPFEFFRNGAIAQNHAVMVVGVGPGFDYSQDGLSHYCLEDLAIAQSQPNLKIKTPFSELEVNNALKEFALNPVPTYLRLPRSTSEIEIKEIRESSKDQKEVVIITTTLMYKRAHNLFLKLQGNHVNSEIVYLSELSKSKDSEIIKKLMNVDCCVVVEDHYEFGGIGSRIAKLIIENNLSKKLVIDSVIHLPMGEIGSHDYMTKKLMKSEQEIYNQIKSKIS